MVTFIKMPSAPGVVPIRTSSPSETQRHPPRMKGNSSFGERGVDPKSWAGFLWAGVELNLFMGFFPTLS